MNCSTPGFSVLHYLSELAQTDVHWVSDAVQPSHPLSHPSPLALDLPSIRVFSSESVLCIRWPKYWTFSSSIRNPITCSLPGSSVHGILQARILEQVTKPFSRGSSWSRDWTFIFYISCTGRQVLYCHLGSLANLVTSSIIHLYLLFPLDCKEIKPVNPKGNQPWIFTGRTDAEAEAPTLATWCKEPTHWKSPWCWERLRAGGKVGNRGWDGWMASVTQWTWVWPNSGRWWRKGKPGMLQSMGSQSIRHDWWLKNSVCNTSVVILLFKFSTSTYCGNLYFVGTFLSVFKTVTTELQAILINVQ